MVGGDSGHIGTEGQGSVRPVAVVMVHEHVENSLKMFVVQDQQPVEALGANGTDEPLRHTVRLWRTKPCADDLHPAASKHLVEALGEFLVAVANQEAERLRTFGQAPRELSGVATRKLICPPIRALRPVI
jgi:hypothetical protein